MLPKIGVAFITHNAKNHLKRCLPPFLNSPLKPRVLVVNSTSSDGTVEEAEKLGAETLVLPRQSFNHGATREAARKHLDVDIIVMATPDAYALNTETLEKLIDPIVNGKSAVSYARQLPHHDAQFFEAFAREFNYPPEGHIRGIEDIQRYGVYTFFCSNSCAAYSNEALNAIGGFQPVLIGEDTVAVAKLLHEGYKIAYTAEAVVHHSHTYSLWQEFQRHFDTGLARQSYRHLLAGGGSDSARGKLYVRTMFERLKRENPRLIPYALLQTIAKWTGYRLGQASVNTPRAWKKIFSGQDFYWT